MAFTKFVLTWCVLIIVQAEHIPEVYEKNATRNVHETFEKPPVFNYKEYQKMQKDSNFDPQRIRYQQQKLIDTKSAQVRSIEDTWAPIPATKSVSSKIASEGTDIELPKHIIGGIVDERKPQSNSYLVNEEEESISNRDDDTKWISHGDRKPKVLSHNLAKSNVNEDLNALNALLRQTPENQIEGLQQLLRNKKHSRLSSNQGSYYNDYTPAKENVWDLPNLQNNGYQPNNNHPNNLKSLQAQLDATATANAESILAQAQKKAQEHVKAQHDAIARVQKQAELVALQQIKEKNEALAREYAEAEAAAEEQRLVEAKKRDEKIKAAERRRQQEQARERARLAALAYKRKQEEEKIKLELKKAAEEEEATAHTLTRKTHSNKAPTKFRRQQNPEAAETHHEEQYKPIQVFSHTPEQQSLSHFRTPISTEHKYEHTFQPAPVQISYKHQPQVMTTSAPIHKSTYENKSKYNSVGDHAEVEKYYIQPQFTVIGQTKNEHGEPELQYAANYEFGYRIRDFEHANHFGHQETKDGESTKGEYHTLLPDGRIQTVSYYVDDTGYHAEVSYAGEAVNNEDSSHV